jgi:hypothetical protein
MKMAKLINGWCLVLAVLLGSLCGPGLAEARAQGDGVYFGHVVAQVPVGLAVEEVLVPEAQSVEVDLSAAPGWLVGFLRDNKWSAVFLMVLGFFRTFGKPLTSLVRSIIAWTPTPKDDVWLLEFEQSAIGKGLLWVVDYLFSIKLTSIDRR